MVKTSHPHSFNEEVQVDYFQLWDQWFMIVIDVATRYKVVTKVSGRDLPTAMKTLLHSWFRFFGPMKRLVSDQESSLMSHEAAVELERLNVCRQPAGTTRGRAQGQHTTTGVVEKHIELVKLCMMKLRAEAERQGLEVDYSDLGAEASFAQNATINTGGYTPHMAVIGTLPMPYYDIDAPGIQAVSGSGHVNPSIYERALRLRQLALTSATQSIVENRIARAAHTRPQRLATENMKAGITEIEFHREDADGYGWRGPGLLLKLQDNGSAIVEYQGRPYLVPLRNLRIFRGVYYNSPLSEEDHQKEKELNSWLALRRLMRTAEDMVPFTTETYGYLRNNYGKWLMAPKSMEEKKRKDIMDDIILTASFLTEKECHGVQLANGVRKILTPAGSIGTLISWRKNTVKMTVVDNPNGTNMTTASIRAGDREGMCFIYLYSYSVDFVELPGTTWRRKNTTMDLNRPALEAPQAQPDDNHQSNPEDMDVDRQEVKRDGPDSRTVTLGPEAKKQKLGFLCPASSYVSHVFLDMHKRQWISWSNHVEARASDDTHEDVYDHYNRYSLFTMKCEGWYADLSVGNIFRVDSTTDMIEENQVAEIWPQVEEADRKEIGQFVDEKAFQAVRRNDIHDQCAIIDAIWVRKWKRTAEKRLVKSRLCVRGCHDPWKQEISNRSTTATRLSQRLILTAAANNHDSLESWDIAGAFLKGLTYEALWKCLRELGLKVVERKIAIVPPRNVWRHLSAISKDFLIEESELDDYVLMCLKPVYGLSEAPLAWQLFLHKYLKELGGIQSHFDECYWYWPAKLPGQWPTSSLTTHVDDLAVQGKNDWLNRTYQKMLTKFGKLTRQTLPSLRLPILSQRRWPQGRSARVCGDAPTCSYCCRTRR